MKEFSDKKPYEEFYLGIDFERDLQDENINTGIVTVTRLLDNKDVTATIVDVAKQQLSAMVIYFWVRTGRPNYKYQFDIRIVGVNGSKYEFNATLKVVQPKGIN